MDSAASARILDLLRSGAPLRAALAAEDALAPRAPFAPPPPDADAHRVFQRAKQLDMGRNTLGYAAYRLFKPRAMRARNDPATPDATRAVTKRAWADAVLR